MFAILQFTNVSVAFLSSMQLLNDQFHHCPGMLRRKQNSTRFVKGGELMKWHVELRFVHADVVHQEKCVPDSRTLLEVRAHHSCSDRKLGTASTTLSRHYSCYLCDGACTTSWCIPVPGSLQLPVPPSPSFSAVGFVALQHVQTVKTLVQVLEAILVSKPGAAKMHVQLHAYVQASAQGCTVFLQRERIPANQQRLQPVTSSSTLREALNGAHITEFPVIHVYLAAKAPQVTLHM